MASSPTNSTPSTVGAPSLNSYLSPYQAHNTKLHTLLHVIILSNNTCILPFYYASISSCTTCETHCRPGQPSVVGGEAGMAKHAPFICELVYHRAYIIPTVLTPGTSLRASTTITTSVRVYNCIYMTLCTAHFPCSIFGTTTAVTTAAVVLLLLLLFSY